MKVDIVEFVENEMVELNVAQIGLNWGWSEDESEFDGDECGDTCGDGHAEKTNPAGIPHPHLHLPLHPPNNRSKPIVLTPFHSLTLSRSPITSITSITSHSLITSHSITSPFHSLTLSYSRSL